MPVHHILDLCCFISRTKNQRNFSKEGVQILYYGWWTWHVNHSVRVFPAGLQWHLKLCKKNWWNGLPPYSTPNLGFELRCVKDIRKWGKWEFCYVLYCFCITLVVQLDPFSSLFCLCIYALRAYHFFFCVLRKCARSKVGLGFYSDLH